MSLKDWIKRVETLQLDEAIVPQASGGATAPNATASQQTTQNANKVSQSLNKLGVTQNTSQLATALSSPNPTTAQNGQIADFVKNTGIQQTLTDPTAAAKLAPIVKPGAMAQNAQGQQPLQEEDIDGITPQVTPSMNEALAQILGNHPHEHKMCQEGWGMDNSLYEALCDHYFKEGRIPRKVWHSSAEDLRKHVEECYGQDTGMLLAELNTDAVDFSDEDTSTEAHHSYQQELKKSQYVPPSRGYSLDSIPHKPRGIDITGGYPGDRELEETSELERMLRTPTKDVDMFEGKKIKKNVVEATKETDTGRIHKAADGGYGRVDTDSEKRKAKADAPKKGRGRPKKDAEDSSSPKFDSSELNSIFGGKKPSKEVGKVSVKRDSMAAAERDGVDEALKGKQSKLDINKNGKLDKGDFAMLRGQKKKDPQMESWDKQLKGLLTEGLTVSTSVGQEGGQDSVSITANNEDAHKLLQILQNAGMGSGVPGHAITATPAPAQVLPKASPSTVGSIANTDGAPNASAQKDIEGGGNSVPIMAMPRGMAFSVNSDDSEMPTEPGEFGTLDQEDVVSALGSEQGSADDGGDSALAAIKKLMGQHGASEVSAPTATPPASKETSDTAASAYDAEEVEESDDSEDEDDDTIPDDGYADGGEPYDDDEMELIRSEKKSKKKDVEEGFDFADATANEIEKNKEGKKVDEEVDMGQYDAAKSSHKGETTPEQEKSFREKVQAYGKELDQRQKEQGVKEKCNECGGLMEDNHECDAQLNEWANSPDGQSEDEQFATDMNFMTNVITAGLNGKKSTGQTTAPVIASQTNRQMSEGYNINVAEMMRKLANIK